MPLFEIAVLRNWEDEDEKEKEELVVKPDCVLSKNEKSAALEFVLKNAEVLEGHAADELEILVRPFV